MRTCLSCPFAAFAGAVLLAYSLTHPVIAQEPEKQERPELDIVILAQLDTPKEHGIAYRDAIRKTVGKAMESLKPKVYGEDDKPVDGAARFRLIVEHRGAVRVGNAIIPVRHRGADGQELLSWQVQTSQEGEFRLRFMQWESGKYQQMGGWSIPAAQDAPGGRIEVASDALQPGQPVPRQMPMTMEEARAKVLEKLTPRDVGAAVLEGITGVQVIETGVQEEADRLRGAADVTVTNLAPWPLEKATVTVEWQLDAQKAVRVRLDHVFTKPLGTRQTERFNGTGWTGDADPRHVRPPRVLAATFGPAPARPAAPMAPAPKKK